MSLDPQGKGGNADRAMDNSQWKDKEILQTNAATAADAWEEEVPRYVGNANNRLLTGVLLHQTRRSPRVLPSMCSAQHERFHDLTNMCTSLELLVANLAVRMRVCCPPSLSTWRISGALRRGHS